ncbi:cytochrome P450 [Stereum hirsutum FP-91666 SS1]|uniref:cytochrome P450 n=1 Tax=Stereum hirsutum (strain FP-91666) TaxID=721885 RepID=UPI0004449FA7|nr:cytochrome P450 [Stereum hirsutum FP-91666 SS1]EIM86329.1 cytochrome P450 [Stereum hirsutum FP-91666 SS1]
MASHSHELLLVTLAFLSLLVIRTFFRRQYNSSGLPYPPGPPPTFIFGNLFDVPKKRAPFAFAEWSKRYNSEIVSFHIPGSHTIIINSAKVAKVIFEQRSSIYSDRQHHEMLYLTGWDLNFAFMRYGPSWRAHRRIVHQYFRSDAMEKFYPLLVCRNNQLLQNLLRDPENVVDQLKHHAGSLPMKLSYDYNIDANGDPLIQKVEESMSVLAQIMIPGHFLVESYPFLARLPEWIPGISGFKACTRKTRVLNYSIENELFEKTKNQIAAGTPPPSLLADALHKNNQGEPGEFVIKRAFATIHVAAADTSMAALTGAMVALIHHPHVQARAQAEIDLIVGRDRLPNFTDMDELPYVSAICREVMRWKLVTPMAVSHAAVKDDIFEGYFIPKGSTVVGNSWAILHDPELYPDPERFHPERFLTPGGTLNDDEILASFGFGRRICPGRHLASATLWLSVVYLLAVFDIVKMKDEKGKDIEVTTEWVDSGISRPMPFQCTVRPRDARAVDLIQSLDVSVPVS